MKSSSYMPHGRQSKQAGNGRERNPMLVERLESRVLLSAGWSTVDSGVGDGAGVVTDAAGNVYAAVGYLDASGVMHGVIRERPAGSSTWGTIADVPNVSFNGNGAAEAHADLAVDAAGNLYAGALSYNGSAHWEVIEKPFGQNSLLTFNDTQSGYLNGVAVDSAGNVFAAGYSNTTMTYKGHTQSVEHWIVRKMSPGGTFTTADDYNDNLLQTSAVGIGVIPAGPAAGIYVVGQASYAGGPATPAYDWLVRKSSDGGKTWATVDTVAGYAGTQCPAEAVVGDSSGNVYVVGSVIESTITGYTKRNQPVYSSARHWLTRHSVGGNTGSWSTIDDYQYSASTPYTDATGFEIFRSPTA